MGKNIAGPARNPQQNAVRSHLDEIVKQGAQELLEMAVRAEVDLFLEKYQYLIDDKGRRLVTGNGHLPERTIATAAGPLHVRMPRVRDQVLKRHGEERFQSRIIPPYLRRTKSLEEFVPFLYLKGVSTGDFTEVLEKLLGIEVKGFSPQQVCRWKECWHKDWEEWSKRSLRDTQYVYWWADGIHFNVRLEDERTCILVLIGAKEDGTKELVAVESGFRESKESWQSVLRDMKARGVEIGPKLAVGDGALGFWRAMDEEFPETRHQICWVHKTANVLDKLPKSLQPRAKSMIHEIYLAETKAEATAAFDRFTGEFDAKYPKAVASLTDHREDLLAFYDFPAEHWQSIRSTNVIESTFATVRLRTRRTKGCGTRIATLTMVFKLAQSAEKRWNRLRGHRRLKEIISGARFVDGKRVKEEMKHEVTV